MPQTAVAASSSLTPGSKWMRCSASRFFAFHSDWSRLPSGEPRYPETKPAVFSPAAASRTCCSIGSRTSAWMPDR